jgi:hypothetical protein
VIIRGDDPPYPPMLRPVRPMAKAAIISGARNATTPQEVAQ